VLPISFNECTFGGAVAFIAVTNAAINTSTFPMSSGIADTSPRSRTNLHQRIFSG